MIRPATFLPATGCVLRNDMSADSERLGGKARALSALSGAGLPVPRWVVVGAEAFDLSLSDERRQALAEASDHVSAAHALEDLGLQKEIQEELQRALNDLADPGSRFAVRSSACEEDTSEHSFAGQLRSYLFVSSQDVADRVADVWRSGFGERVYNYRRERGLRGLPTPPAVLVQLMIDAEVSGVAFSADPVTGNKDVSVVSSVHGMGTALVSGEANADTHRVCESGKILSRELATKDCEHRFSPVSREGVLAVEVSEKRANEWALSDSQAVAVARLARRAAKYFGQPQDIEWAIADGQLYLLQSRPITSLGESERPAGCLNIWDNNNIAESYAGVTTPLTYSFARFAYEGVYTQLCRIFGTPESRIEQLRPALENMIGLFRGRVYYNVLNWYRLLRECPGYRVHAACFEKMIGLQETIPKNALEPVEPPTLSSRLADLGRAAHTLLSVAGCYFGLRRNVPRFHARVHAALDDCPDLSLLPADALVREYRDLVRRLVTRWDAPLINDFFAMIFYGTLGRLCSRWCQDESQTLSNELLCASGGMVSTEPVIRMQRMASLARRDSELVELLQHAPAEEIIAGMASHDEFRREYDAYLAKFGERCNEELKLESQSLLDDPLTLLRAVGLLATQNHEARPKVANGAASPRATAEARVDEAFARRPLQRAVFRWVLRNARRTIRNRENLRLERTRVFGRVRRIFVELGKRLYESAILGDPHDVFYLQVNEVVAFVEGTAVTTDLCALAELRRAEFARYEAEADPPTRFETLGAVYLDRTSVSQIETPLADDGDLRAGMGCCPGRVRGRVRVVTDPRNAILERGDVLVAERTDPGWILLFPFAAGLLVERGNLLSHSAIVARELGIPAIVAIDGVTRWLKDGDVVEFDGASGVVQRTAAAEAAR